MKILSVILSLSYICAGISLLRYVGDASSSGFYAEVLGVCAIFVAIPHLVVVVIRFFVIRDFERAISVVGIFILLVSFLFGARLNCEKVSATCLAGDQIILNIALYHASTGRYPISLTEINNTITPSLKNTEFVYGLDVDKNEFSLRFNLDHWTSCQRTLTTPWNCTD